VGAFALGSLLVFGVKSTQRTNPGETDLVARDYLLMLIFPAIMIFVIVWVMQGFEGALLQSLVGIDWPDTDTSQVNDLLLLDEKTKTFATGAGKVMGISLFAKDKLNNANDTLPDGNQTDNSYYPEDQGTATEWDDRFDADDKARKDGRIQSGAPTYQLKDLFDSAAAFGGILAMALVNFDTADEKIVKKADARKIFQDWNLDFRAEDEWKTLMGLKATDVAVIPAAQQWLKDLPAQPAKSRDGLKQLAQAFGLPASSIDRPKK
jgi:hypothetical protein